MINSLDLYQNRTKKLGDYEINRLLDRGSYGEIYDCRKKSMSKQFIYIAKKYSFEKINENNILKYLKNEKDILKSLEHFNIIKYIDFLKSNNNYYLILERVNGYTLLEVMEKNNYILKEELVQHIIKQISEGLLYLKQKRIIHRDLKLDNIMLHFNNNEDKINLNILNSTVKFIDFGFARYLGEGEFTKSAVGCEFYMDPIILNQFGTKKNNKFFGYNEKADLWSFGIICYQILLGKSPLSKKDIENYKNNICKTKILFPKINSSKESINFINCLLKNDFNERVDIDIIINHKFLRCDIKDLLYFTNGEESCEEIDLNSKLEDIELWESLRIQTKNIDEN